MNEIWVCWDGNAGPYVICPTAHVERVLAALSEAGITQVQVNEHAIRSDEGSEAVININAAVPSIQECVSGAAKAISGGGVGKRMSPTAIAFTL